MLTKHRECSIHCQDDAMWVFCPPNAPQGTKFIEKSAADKLAEALVKTRAAMKYAYEDHVDQYYLNVLEDISKALKEYRGEEC